MADEWSKPVKEGDEWESELLGSAYGYKRVSVADDEVCVETNISAIPAPRDVVLRLLAAEASDRLGWVWEQGDTSEGEPMFRLAIGGPYLQWKTIGARGFEFRQAPQPLTPDEFLAAMHGRFLLADAIREAGQ